ncbi:MAG: hypothetical protein COV43_06370 [Deltaproteobacteria bacterium CG11_big_fil_rev_8_21_14_0_20_42_23]|nr:MAG: hypothetical protein COV43_06370 [Deltaproteobacteria bacterium CG11_big_fil_rev_8_21_14_0_20_42_23]PJC64786.1 MAG: hypothetical protein CO021_02470 [Deltaproteobacteria bacterium CG_4_9_14_0_2_um_filter_42_21]
MKTGTKYFAFAFSVLFLSTQAFAHDYASSSTLASNQSQYGSYQIGIDINSNEIPAVCFVQASQDTPTLVNQNPAVTRALKFSIYNASTQSWDTSTIDDTITSNEYCDLKFDASNIPHVIYSIHSSKKLKHAVLNDNVWRIEDIASLTFDSSLGAAFVDRHLSFEISAQGLLGVAFYDAANSDLKFASLVEDTWVVENVTTSESVGQFPSLDFDSSGNPGIAFMKKNDATQTDVLYSKKSSGTWSDPETVDDSDLSGRYTNLKFDSNNNPQISYRTQVSGGTIQVRHRYKSGGTWSDANTIGWQEDKLDNGLLLDMENDASNNLFFLYYWKQSTIFGASGSLEMDSFLFPLSSASPITTTDTVATKSDLVSFISSDMALSSNHTLYTAWVQYDSTETNVLQAAGLGQEEILSSRYIYTVNVRKLDKWQSQIVLLTPNDTNRNDIAEPVNSFTLEWVDFDPDSDAQIQFSYQDDRWASERTAIGDAVSENAANSLEISLTDIPTGKTIHARISDTNSSGDSWYTDSTSTASLVTPGVVSEEVVDDEEEEVEAEAEEEEIEPEAEEPAEAEAEQQAEAQKQDSGDSSTSNTSGQSSTTQAASGAAGGGCSLIVQEKFRSRSLPTQF